MTAWWIAIGLGVIAASTAFATDLSDQPRIPDDQREIAQKAAAAFQAKRFDEAAGLYETIIKAHPDSLYGWSNLGVVRYQQGRLDKARKAFEQAIKLSPKDAFCLGNLGITDFQLKAYPDAIKALEAAVQADPNDAMSHYFLGQSYDAVGRHAEAGHEFDKAREIQSKKPAPLDNGVPKHKILT